MTNILTKISPFKEPSHVPESLTTYCTLYAEELQAIVPFLHEPDPFKYKH